MLEGSGPLNDGSKMNKLFPNLKRYRFGQKYVVFENFVLVKSRESEPARNKAAPAPAVIFRTGSGSSHFREEKLFGGNVHKMFRKIMLYKNISVCCKIVF